MTNLQQEAKEYIINNWCEYPDKELVYSEGYNSFIAGVNSKTVQCKIIKGKIEVLKEIHHPYNILIENKIFELTQQLIELL